MSFNTYNLGALVKVSATFTVAETEQAIDPDVVNVSVRAPDETVTTFVYGTNAEVIRDDPGEYHSDVNANQSGTWYYRWFSTGDGQAAEENRFEVRPAMAIE